MPDRTNPGRYGPAVIGEEAYEEEKEIKATARHIYGEAVTNSHPFEEEEETHREPPQPKPAPDISPGVPDGFAIRHAGGGWYDVYGPDGVVKNPDSEAGRWSGKDAALEAAKAAAEGSEASPQSENDADGRDSAKEPDADDSGDDSGDDDEDDDEGEAEAPEELTRAAIEAAVEEADGSDSFQTVDEAEDELDGAPEKVLRIYAHEMNRPEGRPRKGVLRALIATEQSRESGPRAAMLEAIEDALEAQG